MRWPLVRIISAEVAPVFFTPVACAAVCSTFAAIAADDMADNAVGGMASANTTAPRHMGPVKLFFILFVDLMINSRFVLLFCKSNTLLLINRDFRGAVVCLLPYSWPFHIFGSNDFFNRDEQGERRNGPLVARRHQPAWLRFATLGCVLPVFGGGTVVAESSLVWLGVLAWCRDTKKP